MPAPMLAWFADAMAVPHSALSMAPASSELPYLTLVLFLPSFALVSWLYWAYPRQPRTARRRWMDTVAISLALLLSILGMRWGYAMGAAEPGAGAIWRHVLSVLVAYGAFLATMSVAVLVRTAVLRR